MKTTSSRTFQLLLAIFCLLFSGASRSAAQARFHTRSIAACDPTTGSCGVAVVSSPTGVSAFVPVGEPGVIVANQSAPLLSTARAIVENIKQGSNAQTALDLALADDPLPDERQFGVAALSEQEPSGVTVATFTGAANFEAVCDLTGTTYAVQANTQTSEKVCQAIADGFEAAQGSLPIRLFEALAAGGEVGGDQRGEFSAGVVVYSDSFALAESTELETQAIVTRSADWQADLEFAVHAYVASNTRRDVRDATELTFERARDAQQALANLGFYTGPITGIWTPPSELALRLFTGFNTLFPAGTAVNEGQRFIDGPTLEYLLEGERRGALRPF